MGRRQTEWTAQQEAEFRRLARSGLSAGEIGARLRKQGVPGASTSSVERRLRLMMGSRRGNTGPAKASAKPTPKRASASPRPAAEAAPPPASSRPAPMDLSDIPDDPETLASATPHELDIWIARANSTYESALAAENLAVQVSSIGKAKELLDAKRKATPPPAPDPNANPDFVALAEKCRRELLKLIDPTLVG